MMHLKHPLKDIVDMQKNGKPTGIYSICSANEYVIEAAMEKALVTNTPVLIEATANQVNQFGGYTGMRPADFRDFVLSIARRTGFPIDNIILGGDHLGPLTWKDEKADTAMEKAAELIRQYVLAGFTKIHIDTSMHLADDAPDVRLDTGVIARRGASLCQAAVEAFAVLLRPQPDAIPPVYVIGSEVPIPGGSQEEEDGLQVTKAADFEETVRVYKSEFEKCGLTSTWENVIAVVVQPGVEFGDEVVHEYDRERAKALVSSLSKFPGMVFEGHSTDYQTAEKLRQMVEDGIAILKVGPALTFALREGLFALAFMERMLFEGKRDMRLSNFIETLDNVMIDNPDNWKKHYHGSDEKIVFARRFSLSDRCRYYLPVLEVADSIKLLISNLRTVKIPLTLISQFMPIQYARIRSGSLENDPEALLKDRVTNCIEDYIYATSQ